MIRNWTTIYHQNWIWSYSPPVTVSQLPPLLLLHGFSGDETSLHQLVDGHFASRWLIAPRGLLQAPDKGFSWAPQYSRTLADFLPASSMLVYTIDPLMKMLGGHSPFYDLLGFSQGAALASVLLLTNNTLFSSAAILSGFVPDLPDDFKIPDLSNHRVFISHGTEDEIIPFQVSRSTNQFFENTGANVEMCITKTRHKIGAPCVQDLFAFFDS